MLAGADGEHDLVVGEDGGNGQGAAGEGLADGDHVRAHAFVVAGEQLAGAADAGLDLVGDEQHVVRVAQVEAFLEVALVRDIDAGFALDGLHDHGADLVALFVQDLPQRLGVVIGNVDETGREGPVLAVAVRVAGHRDDGDGAAVEVAVGHDDEGLVLRDALHLVAPAAGQLEGRLDGLGAGVHRQKLVIAEVLGGHLLVGAQAVVVEGAGGQAQLLGLVAEGLHDLGVAVSLVDGGIGRQEIVVPLAVHVPDIDALAPFQDDGQRVIVVRAVFLLHLDELGGGVLLGGHIV